MDTLDKTDILILKALQENGRITVKDLALKVHLSPTPVFERMHRLEKEGSVSAYEQKKEGRVRRYYRLTRKGGEKLRERTEAWVRYAGAMNAVLCGTPG